METTSFFAGTTRVVKLGSPTLLIAKGGTRRLRLPIKMPLTGQNLIGMPDWLGNAFTAVSQNFTQVEPPVQQIADISLYFRNEEPKPELFAHPDARIPNAELRTFTVLRTGESDDPEVEMHCTIYAPFAREFWKWIGEKAGENVHLHFPSTKAGAVEVVTPPLPLPHPDKPETDPANDEAFAFANSPSGIPKTEPTLESVFGVQAASEDTESPKGKPGKRVKSGESSTPGARKSLTVN